MFQVVKELKEQKMIQNDKNFCLSHLIFQGSYIIWSSCMVPMYVWKDNISRHLFNFFCFENFDLWDHYGGSKVVKGQKMTQNDKKFCLSCSVSPEPYVIWLWFLVHMFHMMISPAFFFIVNILSFGVFRWVKGQKMT